MGRALRLGALVGYVTTAASMVAAVNAVVADAGVSLLTRHLLGAGHARPAVLARLAVGIVMIGAFFAYQRWRIAEESQTLAADPSSSSTKPRDHHG